MKEKAPVPQGQYAVGTLTYTVDNNRTEVMYPTQKRRVACRVYYPVLKNSVNGCEKMQYMSMNMAKGIKQAFKIPINYNKITALGENVSECYMDAPRIQEVRFPLILFSHGYNSYREGNSYLLLELASQGYVVISVAHSMEGVCTEFDDGSVLFYDRSITRKTYQPYIGGVIGAMKLTKQKGSDVELAEKFDEFQNKYSKFLMGRLEEWKEDVRSALIYAKENFKDFIDFNMGIGVSGHSFGGDVAYALCAEDKDFICGINIDGALFGNYRDKVLDKPFIQISCDDNENVVTRVYLRHTKPVYKILFRDMKHIGFSDMKFFVPLKAMVGKLNPNQLHENLCKCHTEFFNTYLKKEKQFFDVESNEVVSITKFEPDM